MYIYIYIFLSLSTRYSCTVTTCTAAVPFRPPDGRAAVADKLPHYAYAAYAPPKFAAGSPCSQPLKTLYFVRFLASFLIRYIYIYTHTSSVPSPSFSRLLSVRCLSLSISFPGLPITFLPRASSTSRGQLPRTLYFLLPVPCGDFLQRFPPFHSATYIPITMMLFRSEDRLVSIIIYGG